MPTKQSFHIVSYSGGKDSTAMLLLLLEKGYPVDDIVFCDTGMEFPEMYKHIIDVEKYIKRPITRIHGLRSFQEFLSSFKKRNGQIGYGHPDMSNRWCTQRLKKDPMDKYLRAKRREHGDIIQYHGIASDEPKRIGKNQSKISTIEYPLVEWGITEKEALEYCYHKGFTWGGLYEDFSRVSCWCCPMSSLVELKVLYTKYPELWLQLQEMDSLSWRQFRADYSVEQLTNKFKGGQ